MKIDFFKKEKFEELLTSNWFNFFDSTKLLSFVNQKIKENLNNLAIITSYDIKSKGNKLTISRFEWNFNCFIIWLDFTTSINDKIAEGTMEINLYSNNSIEHIRTIGTIS